jgi:rhodanese-related sulfurtransferase
MKGALIVAVLLGQLAPALAVADPGCCGGCPSKAVTAVTADELKALLDSEKKPLVVNVLGPEAYHKAHIAGSINIPLAHLKSLQGALDKNATVVTYCAGPACPASDKAAAQLSASGFKDVRVYKGGIQEWSEAGRPVEKGEPVRFVSKEDLKALRESGKAFTLIDVLAPGYFEKGHIEGAINVPLADLETRAGELTKDARIVVYCYNYICGASTQAAEKLAKLGFKDVSDYKGGFQEWKEAGLPVAGPVAGPAAPAGSTGTEGASSGGCCPSKAEPGCASGSCDPPAPQP